MKKLNNKGSTIVTSIIVVMIILIIVGAALMIANSYQKRAVNEHARKQAYMNAVGICDAIAGELNGANASQFLPENDSTPKKITEVRLPAKMTDTQDDDKPEITSSTGTITGEIRYEKNDKTAIYIKIVSKYAQQTQTIELKLRKYGGKWAKVHYTDGSGNEVNPSE